MEAVARSSYRTYQQDFDELRRDIEATPRTAKVKGMFIDSVMKCLDRQKVARPTSQRFISFKDYPLRDLMQILLDTSALVHPSLPPKEALKLLGRLVYPTLAESTVGRILFSIAGRDFKAALSLAGRAYQISLEPCSAELKEVSEGKATLALRECYNFADSYQVGVLEGAMECYTVEGTVQAVRLGRACDVDLVIRWR